MREGIPGCNVASTTFFARQISGVIRFSSPVLYLVTRVFACSSPVPVTSKVLNSPTTSRRQPPATEHGGFLVSPAPSSREVFPGMVYTSSISHLGSDISADCFTRPQYVERSYCDAGRSRVPGREEDMERKPLRQGAIGEVGGKRATRAIGWTTEPEQSTLLGLLRSRRSR